MIEQAQIIISRLNLTEDKLEVVNETLKDLYGKRYSTFNFLGEHLYTYENLQELEKVTGTLSDTKLSDIRYLKVANLDNSLLIVNTKDYVLNPSLIQEYLTNGECDFWTYYDETSFINQDGVIVDTSDILLIVKKHKIRLKKPAENKIYASTYAYIYKKPLHRLIMGNPVGKVIDHINCNSLDNRKSNLRITTQALNVLNKGVMKSTRKNKTSKYQGVSLAKRKNNRIHIRLSVQVGKQRICKNYKTEIKAAIAYDVIMLCLAKEYANINFPIENYSKNFLEKFQNLYLKNYNVCADLE